MKRRMSFTQYNNIVIPDILKRKDKKASTHFERDKEKLRFGSNYKNKYRNSESRI